VDKGGGPAAQEGPTPSGVGPIVAEKAIDRGQGPGLIVEGPAATGKIISESFIIDWYRKIGSELKGRSFKRLSYILIIT
jgi:hypothetical protein